MNTWAWLATLLPMKLLLLVMGGWPFGYWQQTRFNFFAKVIVPNGIHHAEIDSNSFLLKVMAKRQ